MPQASRRNAERTLEDYQYFQTYRTRWSDNDQYSHVNNAVYYHLIDSIVNAYLAERCSCDPSSTSNTSGEDGPPIGFVVSSYCDFFAPFSFPEPVTLGLRVVKLGRSSVSYEVGFFSGADASSNGKKNESAKAVGGYTHVFVDRLHRRPVKAMPNALKEGLQAILLLSDSSAKPKL